MSVYIDPADDDVVPDSYNPVIFQVPAQIFF